MMPNRSKCVIDTVARKVMPWGSSIIAGKTTGRKADWERRGLYEGNLEQKRF